MALGEELRLRVVNRLLAPHARCWLAAAPNKGAPVKRSAGEARNGLVPRLRALHRRLLQAEVAMKCPIRKTGETTAGTVTVSLVWRETTVPIKETSPDVRQNCGEY